MTLGDDGAIGLNFICIGSALRLDKKGFQMIDAFMFVLLRLRPVLTSNDYSDVLEQLRSNLNEICKYL